MNAKHANVAGLKGAVIRHKVLCVIMALSLIMLMIPSGLRANAQQTENATNTDNKQEQVEPAKGGEQQPDPSKDADKQVEPKSDEKPSAPEVEPEKSDTKKESSLPLGVPVDSYSTFSKLNETSRFEADSAHADIASFNIEYYDEVYLGYSIEGGQKFEVWASQEDVGDLFNNHDTYVIDGAFSDELLDNYGEYPDSGRLANFDSEIQILNGGYIEDGSIALNYWYTTPEFKEYVKDILEALTEGAITVDVVQVYRSEIITPINTSNDVFSFKEWNPVIVNGGIAKPGDVVPLHWEGVILPTISAVANYDTIAKNHLVYVNINGASGVNPPDGFAYIGNDLYCASVADGTTREDVEEMLSDAWGPSRVRKWNIFQEEATFKYLHTDDDYETITDDVTYTVTWGTEMLGALRDSFTQEPIDTPYTVVLFDNDGNILDSDEGPYPGQQYFDLSFDDYGQVAELCVLADGYDFYTQFFDGALTGQDLVQFIYLDPSNATFSGDGNVVSFAVGEATVAEGEEIEDLNIYYCDNPFTMTLEEGDESTYTGGFYIVDSEDGFFGYVERDLFGNTTYRVVLPLTADGYDVNCWYFDGEPLPPMDDLVPIPSITPGGGFNFSVDTVEHVTNASLYADEDVDFFNVRFYVDGEMLPIQYTLPTDYEFDMFDDANIYLSSDNTLIFENFNTTPFFPEIKAGAIELIPEFNNPLHEPYVWTINGEEVEFGEIWDHDWYFDELGRCDIAFTESESPIGDYNASITAEDDDAILGYNVSVWFDGEEIHNVNVDDPYYTYFASDYDLEEGYTATLTVNENNQLHYRVFDEYDDVVFEKYITAICTDYHDTFEWNINGVDMHPGSFPYECEDGWYEIVCETVGTTTGVLCPGTEGHDSFHYSMWILDPEEGVYEEDYVDSFADEVYEDCVISIDEDGTLYGTFVDEDEDDYCEGAWFEAVPEPGYKLASWTINGVEYEVGEAHHAVAITEQAVPATGVANYVYVGDDEPGGHGQGGTSPKTGDFALAGIAILGMIAVAGAAYLGYRRFANNR